MKLKHVTVQKKVDEQRIETVAAILLKIEAIY